MERVRMLTNHRKLLIVVVALSLALLTTLIALLFTAIDLVDSTSTIVTKTAYGKVCGKREVTLFKESPYYSFRGIPYARPPIGELRFQVNFYIAFFINSLKKIDFSRHNLPMVGMAFGIVLNLVENVYRKDGKMVQKTVFILIFIHQVNKVLVAKRDMLNFIFK